MGLLQRRVTNWGVDVYENVTIGWADVNIGMFGRACTVEATVPIPTEHQSAGRDDQRLEFDVCIALLGLCKKLELANVEIPASMSEPHDRASMNGQALGSLRAAERLRTMVVSTPGEPTRWARGIGSIGLFAGVSRRQEDAAQEVDAALAAMGSMPMAVQGFGNSEIRRELVQAIGEIC